MKRLLPLLLLGLLLTAESCRVVRQDQVGVKRRSGRIVSESLVPGLYVLNPFTTKVLKLPTRTINREVTVYLPSKEGLTVVAEISILYRIDASKAPQILKESGADYENTIVLPVFRSATADVSSRYFAKDMHSGERASIEVAIRDHMNDILGPKGFIIESVLMKSIRLPERLSRAIEEKLEAEQRSQRMQFVLEQARQEAERLRIEAEGVRDAQRIIGEGLTPLVIQYQSIEAFRELSASPNTKTIITDGKAPLLID